MKLLEESAAQRETQVRQECEDLMERLATATRSAEQERSELQAQYQRKLAQAQQDRDREVERLRDLQRYTGETSEHFILNKLKLIIDLSYFAVKEIYLGDEERPRGPGPQTEEIKGRRD